MKNIIEKKTSKQIAHLICLLGISVLMFGCAGTKQTGEISAQKEMESFTKIPVEEPVEVPDAVSQALFNSQSHQREMTEMRFDVSVNQVPARTFFMSLVGDAGVNVVAHPDIDGRITLELKNVTVKDVLNVTREVYGYEYRLKNGIYSIYPRKIRTEVFPINYPDIQRTGVTDTSVSVGQIESGSDDDNNNNSGDNNNQSDSSNRAKESASGSRVITTNYTDFWSMLNATLSAIIGGEVGGRMVMTNPQAGLVIVKAKPIELTAVRDFLEQSELSVRRQVVLETKILEVRLNDRFETGINWAAIEGQLALSQSVSGTGFIGSALGKASNASSAFSSVLGAPDITKLLQLLETQGNVQVLSSPRISTVNNQKAVIKVGSDEFFVTGIRNNSTSNAATTTNIPEIVLDSFFSGIALDVTPQIAEDGDVILHVHPVVSDVQDQIKEISIADEKFSLPLALRDIRESDSIVRAKHGEVVVLGGLMQEVSSDVSGKRPGLGDVPIVNAFFKTKNKAKIKTELVILMRPIVIESGGWDQQVEDGKQRINSISEIYRSR
ncbi:pilus (MSHA type) biogenesis protein MshL [Teredinibacter sp. KSP-S5-2]|uniref:pilus (MSHA type) biogenesis protein MshL n=1 Tax=Teredinibacter sp. KSP-S5-2 TaxID=3034506 RepID=UPI002934BC27|nr:pilus (MSHA type) biogenesis protein MshL [Teredinibacter sp. KSP-S5-2]WNO09901.1 pilus (MSHA type) biogenesis protein MshL [Teredinibacter sp. KSP-S5-2]